MTTEQARQAALAWFAETYKRHARRAIRFPAGNAAEFRRQTIDTWLAGFEAGQRDGAKLADIFRKSGRRGCVATGHSR